MTGELLDTILRRIVVVEGGVSNHASDRGGLTAHGLTRPFLETVTGRSWTDAQIVAIGSENAIAIYKLWAMMRRLDQLPEDYLLAWVVVDFAVIAGERRAIRAIQKYMGVPADGIAGAETQGAWHRLTPEECRGAALFVLAERIAHHGADITANPGQAANAKGWANRVAEQVRACA